MCFRPVLGQGSLFTGGCSVAASVYHHAHSTFILASGSRAAGDTCLWVKGVTLSAPGMTLLFQVCTGPNGGQRQEQARGLRGESSWHTSCQPKTPGLVPSHCTEAGDLGSSSGSATSDFYPHHTTKLSGSSFLV